MMGFYDEPGFFGIMNTLFPVFFITIFLFIVGVFIAGIVSSARQWHRNNQSPVLDVTAKVVAKRTNVSSRHRGEHGSAGSSTSYYVTFEVESGDRMELQLTGEQYGLMVEGDEGKLTFQGTRFLGFKRHNSMK